MIDLGQFGCCCFSSLQESIYKGVLPMPTKLSRFAAHRCDTENLEEEL